MNLEFIDITPDNYRWINQKALYAFDKSTRLGSLMVTLDEDDNAAYRYEINGLIDELPCDCKTWKEAEDVFLEVMLDYFNNQESYYHDLRYMCNDLIQSRN